MLEAVFTTKAQLKLGCTRFYLYVYSISAFRRLVVFFELVLNVFTNCNAFQL